MRAVQWLFVVGVLLFITGIGFVIAGARSARLAPPAQDAAPAPMPVASILQIMNGISEPNALAVYNAVGTIINVEGVQEIAPANDEEWAALADSAAALVESGNLMLLEGRLVDTGDWVTMTRAFMDASVAALKAAEAKSTEGILEAGAEIYQTCETCHEKYAQ